MRKLLQTLYTALILFGSCQFLYSQQVYQLKHYGGPGTIYLYNPATGLLETPSIIQAGENVSWDITSYTTLNTHPTQIVTPSQAFDQFTFTIFCSLSGIPAFDCFNIWSQTEQALQLEDSLSLLGLSLLDLKRFQNKTSNLLLENFFGFTVNFQGAPTDAVIVYQQPDTIFSFPLAYGAEWSSRINWNVDLSVTGENIMYSSKQNRTSSVDAWGTVYTPYDTFTNVVRVRSEIVSMDSLFTDTIDIPVNFRLLEYMWFDTSYKLPIMIARGIITDTMELITNLEYIYEETCPQATWTVTTDADVYYLDQSGNVTVNFTLENPNADEYTWDFGDGNIETTTGNISHTYNIVGEFGAGVTACMTNCLPLNTCETAFIDFTILDTTTSVEIIPGELLGITLYPNPAKNVISIEIPETIGTQHYIVSDITGRQIDDGMMNTGITQLLTNTWGNGVYTIRFRSKVISRSQMAVMKFALIR